MRVEKAIELLELIILSIEQISFRVGYHNSSTLSKQIKKQTGQTTATLRGHA